MDLTTKYLGITLCSPLVPSSSPLCNKIDNLKRMEDAGASAVVLESLFEEQLLLERDELDYHLSHGTESFAEALSYFPQPSEFRLGPETYLEHVAKAKAAVKIPVIASLNGVSTGGWVEYARKIQDAGADALELNIYYLATDPGVTGQQVEQQYCDLVRAIKANLKIPVAVKLGYAFSAFANMATRLEQAGAEALVIFNRFYQPDFDLENLEVAPHLHLSTPYELRLRLHWTAILFPIVKIDLAITGGVHSATDVVKAMMAGARVAMMTSALLQHGIGHLTRVRADLERWMEEHEYSSIQQMQGSMSRWAVAEPAAYERANYMRMLSSYVPRPA